MAKSELAFKSSFAIGSSQKKWQHPWKKSLSSKFDCFEGKISFVYKHSRMFDKTHN